MPRFLVLVGLGLIGAIVPQAEADLPRRPLIENPRILGREVKELVLTGVVPVGKTLPPGLPTTNTYKMSPNRFRPVSEDAEGVFYQAVGPLQKRMPMSRGGVYMNKKYPDMIMPYRGDATNVRLPLGIWEPLHPGHVRMFRVVFAKANSH